MGKRKLGALEKVDADLASLQYKIRRDPTSYREEFIKQYEQYGAQRDIFMATPASTVAHGSVSFKDLIDFMAHVADCYPDLMTTFPDDLIKILTMHHAELEPELREKIVGSLVLLRNKDVIDSPKLLLTLFPILTTTSSKSLRAILFQKILSDLRSANSKTKNHRLNRTIQTVLFNLLCSDRASPKGIWAVKLTRELWKRQVWTDAKAVEIMKEASLADNVKVATGGIRFFLGVDQDQDEEESSDEEDGVDIKKLRHQAGINKKTKKKARTLEKAVAVVKKKERKKNQPHQLNFSALQLLHDPQGFAEVLFSKHLQNSKSKLNLPQKLLVLQLVSRLVGLHKLTLINLYSYFLKYLTPRQPSVTSFLASLAQASHNLVPPDMLEPLVQKIANEFISEAAASEVASAGLNAIREICVRQPLAMSNTLLQDLVMYRKSKDKGVMMAAKGLLSLYREVGAELLQKKDRGKTATMELKSGGRKERRFGEEEIGGIEGIELLEEWKKEEGRRKREEKGLISGEDDEDENENEEEDWAAWNVEEDEDSDDSGGWINVDDDDGDLEISDSDEEDISPPTKKPKTQGDDGNLNTTAPDGKEEDPKEPSISNLATTKILTPQDLLKLQELRNAQKIQQIMQRSNKKTSTTRNKNQQQQQQVAIQNNNSHNSKDPGSQPVLPTDLVRTNKRPHHHHPDDDDDDDDGHQHRSKAAIRQARKMTAGKSSTNKEKARRKNVLMTLGKARGKAKRSLVERSRVLRAHVERGKRGGRRGNR